MSTLVTHQGCQPLKFDERLSAGMQNGKTPQFRRVKSDLAVPMNFVQTREHDDCSVPHEIFSHLGLFRLAYGGRVTFRIQPQLLPKSSGLQPLIGLLLQLHSRNCLVGACCSTMESCAFAGSIGRPEASYPAYGSLRELLPSSSWKD